MFKKIPNFIIEPASEPNSNGIKQNFGIGGFFLQSWSADMSLGRPIFACFIFNFHFIIQIGLSNDETEISMCKTELSSSWLQPFGTSIVLFCMTMAVIHQFKWIYRLRIENCVFVAIPLFPLKAISNFCSFFFISIFIWNFIFTFDGASVKPMA